MGSSPSKNEGHSLERTTSSLNRRRGSGPIGSHVDKPLPSSSTILGIEGRRVTEDGDGHALPSGFELLRQTYSHLIAAGGSPETIADRIFEECIRPRPTSETSKNPLHSNFVVVLNGMPQHCRLAMFTGLLSHGFGKRSIAYMTQVAPPHCSKGLHPAYFTMLRECVMNVLAEYLQGRWTPAVCDAYCHSFDSNVNYLKVAIADSDDAFGLACDQYEAEIVSELEEAQAAKQHKQEEHDEHVEVVERPQGMERKSSIIKKTGSMGHAPLKRKVSVVVQPTAVEEAPESMQE